MVRKGNIDISDLYSERVDARYYYTFGTNLRAVAAFIIGFTVPLPGFIGSFGTTTVSVAASRMYALGWALSFVVGGLVYWILCLIFPVPGDDSKQGFEQSARYYDENDFAEEHEKVPQVIKRMDSQDEDVKETV